MFFAFGDDVFIYRPMPCTPAGDVIAMGLGDGVAERVAEALQRLYLLGYFNGVNVRQEAERIISQCGQVRWQRQQNAASVLGWREPTTGSFK